MQEDVAGVGMQMLLLCRTLPENQSFTCHCRWNVAQSAPCNVRGACFDSCNSSSLIPLQVLGCKGAHIRCLVMCGDGSWCMLKGKRPLTHSFSKLWAPLFGLRENATFTTFLTHVSECPCYWFSCWKIGTQGQTGRDDNMVLVKVLEPDDTKYNLHSGFVVLFWGPDYSNSFINIPVNNYWLLVMMAE